MKVGVGLDAVLAGYIDTVGVRHHPALVALKAETATMGAIGGMQITAEQGAFMALLAQLMGARTYLEIGVFTGYSSLALALALPEDGRITALDVSEAFTAVARRHWIAAGVDHKIDLRLAPALDSLADLARAGARFDMAFIDADKPNYDAYYEAVLGLVRPGGLIAIDNVLWDGKVADPTIDDPSTAALRALNLKIHADPRVEGVLAPIGDGLYLLRRL